MRSSHRVLTLFALTNVLLAACGGEPNQNPTEPTGSVSQALYTGPYLKMPLPPGYRWRLNTEAGGKSVAGFDPYHSDHYYSLDFGRHVQDNNGKETTILNPDGSGLANPADSVDILAAATGTIVDVNRKNCVINDADHPCYIKIDHANAGYPDYSTWYYHFRNETIPVELKAGVVVAQGQFLGKMGSTGDSTGAHLHFEVRYNGFNGPVSQKTPELEGVTLEGIKFSDYKLDPNNPTGKFVYYPSTNGFAYRPKQAYGANPRVCKNALLIDPWSLDFTCIQQNAFQTYRPVYSDLRIDEVQKDACYNVEYWRNNQYYTGMSVGCTNGAAGNSWYLSVPAFYTAQPGSYEVRYFVSTKDRLVFLPAPMAVAKFTVLGQSNQPPPTKVSPAQGTIIHLADSLRWNDAAPYQVTDHDLFFWVWDWNAGSWKPFGFIYSWASSPYPVAKAGLPTNRWVGWVVRSCTDNVGCSGWSQFTYFGLLP